ncbi:hypothetical protein K435DRAFT_425274 [Dendrothele bispora CBS 962.96]|uniref:Uncharacterized protein n=1 Tax=Dendrothele bispora (strain CBS 962.96) TaxID=1314807 RepID=A0A4S8L545_DENBC|nr:hypothetical protein K435DRAFT_425274 [Dendrothele bispora CBS 962.96]
MSIKENVPGVHSGNIAWLQLTETDLAAESWSCYTNARNVTSSNPSLREIDRKLDLGVSRLKLTRERSMPHNIISLFLQTSLNGFPLEATARRYTCQLLRVDTSTSLAGILIHLFESVVDIVCKYLL